MKTKLLFIGFLIGGSALITAQTTLNIKVNAALNDHEERTSGPVSQTGTLGDMYAGSTGLELGNDQPTADPVMVGLRFTNVTIPKFASIVSGYIQFTVKGTTKNTNPCNLTVYAENNVNPAIFSDNAFNLSGRTLAAGSIAWNVSGTSWATVGSAGTEQRTSDLKSLLQPLVFNPSWVSGNPMVFFIKGVGTREVESFEGDAAKAPELVVTYSVAGSGTLTTNISEFSKKSSVSVYPNPFKNTFTTSIEITNPSDVNISVIDMTGKIVEEKIVKNVSSGNFNYTSNTHLNPGMYFVKVQANNAQEVIKIISE